MKEKDLTPEEFKELGYKFINWASDYFANIEKFPVLSRVHPGDIKKELPQSAPLTGENIEQILNDFNSILLKGITHWNHPGFMAYFNSTASAPGIFAEFLMSTLNVNGMLWKSSPSSTELEEVVLKWFRHMLSMPDNLWGIIYDTASVSSMHAIAAARHKAYPEIREKGMSSSPQLVMYCSEQAHSSIEKGGLTLGIGLKNIRKIPVDDQFRMKVSILQEMIDEDKLNGKLPFCVVATIGTTSTTSIDPLKEIGEIAVKENLWLHVDSAHSGVTAILPEMRYIFDGIENADSIVINPHKWMFVPMDISVLYIKHPDILKEAFSLVPEYLKTSQDSEVINYMDYGIQLGRRFRSLKLWFVIRYFGIEGLSSIYRKHLELAQKFKSWLEKERNFEILAPVHFSTVTFRFKPDGVDDLDQINFLNEKLMHNVNETGIIFISHTKINGKFILRLVISGIRTELKHVYEAKEVITKEAANLIT